tara:strand:- start:992 stop:1144 length:153 start_codon:yes stop_codon:yes gene_type:complete
VKLMDTHVDESTLAAAEKNHAVQIFDFTCRVTGFNSRRPGGGDPLDAGLG